VKPHDALAKDLLRNLLARTHAVQLQRAVQHEPQLIDVYATPLLPGREGRRARARLFGELGWLARMVTAPSCFEAQSTPLRRSQLAQARRRQFAAWHELQREQRAAPPRMLWLLAAERAPKLDRLFELRDQAEWPRGFRFAAAGERWCRHRRPGVDCPVSAIEKTQRTTIGLERSSGVPSPRRGHP
jgi:hypothetical protein